MVYFGKLFGSWTAFELRLSPINKHFMSPRLLDLYCALVSLSFAKHNGYGRLSHWFVHFGQLFWGWTDFSFRLSANKLFKKCCQHHHWEHIEIWQSKVLPAALVLDDLYHHHHHNFHQQPLFLIIFIIIIIIYQQPLCLHCPIFYRSPPESPGWWLSIQTEWS